MRRMAEVRPSSLTSTTDILSDFYREEFIKHQQCLKEQRECFSEGAMTNVEAALSRMIDSLDQICTQHDAGELVSRWLHRLDTVTKLSTWSDAKRFH